MKQPDFFTASSTLLMNTEDKSTSSHGFRNIIDTRLRNNSGSKNTKRLKENNVFSSNTNSFATIGRNNDKNKFEKRKLSKSISYLDQRIPSNDNLFQFQDRSRIDSSNTKNNTLYSNSSRNPSLYSNKVSSTSKFKDPIINTMLDAMQKVSVKYTSGNYKNFASKTCVSGTMKEPKRKSVNVQDFLSWECDETDL